MLVTYLCTPLYELLMNCNVRVSGQKLATECQNSWCCVPWRFMPGTEEEEEDIATSIKALQSIRELMGSGT